MGIAAVCPPGWAGDVDCAPNVQCWMAGASGAVVGAIQAGLCGPVCESPTWPRSRLCLRG